MIFSVLRPGAPLIARSQICRVAPRVAGSQVNTVRFFAIGDELKKKESVEETRYIREQEKKFFEKKRAEKASSEHDQEMAVYEEVVAPAMVEAQELLKKSGDEVSAEGLELLAKWKLGLKK